MRKGITPIQHMVIASKACLQSGEYAMEVCGFRVLENGHLAVYMKVLEKKERDPFDLLKEKLS